MHAAATIQIICMGETDRLIKQAIKFYKNSNTMIYFSMDIVPDYIQS